MQWLGHRSAALLPIFVLVSGRQFERFDGVELGRRRHKLDLVSRAVVMVYSPPFVLPSPS